MLILPALLLAFLPFAMLSPTGPSGSPGSHRDYQITFYTERNCKTTTTGHAHPLACPFSEVASSSNAHRATLHPQTAPLPCLSGVFKSYRIPKVDGDSVIEVGVVNTANACHLKSRPNIFFIGQSHEPSLQSGCHNFDGPLDGITTPQYPLSVKCDTANSFKCVHTSRKYSVSADASKGLDGMWTFGPVFNESPAKIQARSSEHRDDIGVPLAGKAIKESKGTRTHVGKGGSTFNHDWSNGFIFEKGVTATEDRVANSKREVHKSSGSVRSGDVDGSDDDKHPVMVKESPELERDWSNGEIFEKDDKTKKITLPPLKREAHKSGDIGQSGGEGEEKHPKLVPHTPELDRDWSNGQIFEGIGKEHKQVKPHLKRDAHKIGGAGDNGDVNGLGEEKHPKLVPHTPELDRDWSNGQIFEKGTKDRKSIVKPDWK
ncbi:hypothetical protein CBS101457_002789 [Exobasidium rhododendri]|nr:hypothetical protein CBS101457_002789 [Exobasidium rhododendri]